EAVFFREWRERVDAIAEVHIPVLTMVAGAVLIALTEEARILHIRTAEEKIDAVPPGFVERAGAGKFGLELHVVIGLAEHRELELHRDAMKRITVAARDRDDVDDGRLALHEFLAQAGHGAGPERHRMAGPLRKLLVGLDTEEKLPRRSRLEDESRHAAGYAI